MLHAHCKGKCGHALKPDRSKHRVFFLSQRTIFCMLTFTTFFQESDSAEYIVDCLYIDALYLAMGTHRLDICITSSTVYYNQI